MRPFAEDEKGWSAKLVEVMCCVGQYHSPVLGWQGGRSAFGTEQNFLGGNALSRLSAGFLP